MGRFIPEEVIEEIRASSDIVDVISDTVRLKKQGNNYTGLCPFHNEKTPSFMVSRDKQIFRCFGCGEGGNAFSFVAKRDNSNFPEAVRTLAQRAGIIIPEDDDQIQSAELKERERFFKVNELAKNYYQDILLNHDTAKGARNYLKNRGITLETIESFQMGFAPPSWDSLLQFLNREGYSGEELEKMGLVLAKTKDVTGFYDRFRNRIMFPIWNVQGKVAGFGGRVLDDGLPKYLNSPETLVFNKSYNLYGINKALNSIRHKDQAIIVEGYLDVITCHQSEIMNVVASLGTAFTKEQGKLLLRYTREIVIAYDTDAAGIKATMKGWQVLDDIGCNVKVVSIPDGKDPDEYIRNHGPEKFMMFIRENALNLCDYKTDRAMEIYDIYTLEGKFKIASEVIPSIRNMSNEIEKDEAIMKLAKRLHLSQDAIRTEVEKNTSKSRNGWIKRDKIADFRDNNSKFVESSFNHKEEKDSRSRAEVSLLALMLNDKKVFSEVKKEIGVHFSSKQEYLNIIDLLNGLSEKESDYQPAALFDQIQDKNTAEALILLLTAVIPIQGSNKTKMVGDCLKVIRQDELRKKREDLLTQMEEADKKRDHELRKQLLLKYSKLI